MGLFQAMNTSGTGLNLFRTWLDTVSHNIANISTARRTDEAAFQAQYVQAQAVESGGVAVTGFAFGNAEGQLVHDPAHPLADEDGMVRMPDIELADQMTQLIAAQRGYQANLAVIDRARDAYAQALQIGRS